MDSLNDKRKKAGEANSRTAESEQATVGRSNVGRSDFARYLAETVNSVALWAQKSTLASEELEALMSLLGGLYDVAADLRAAPERSGGAAPSEPSTAIVKAPVRTLTVHRIEGRDSALVRIVVAAAQREIAALNAAADVLAAELRRADGLLERAQEDRRSRDAALSALQREHRAVKAERDAFRAQLRKAVLQ